MDSKVLESPLKLSVKHETLTTKVRQMPIGELAPDVRLFRQDAAEAHAGPS